MQMASVERRHLFQSGTPNETWKQALEVSSSAGKTRKVVEVVLADDSVAGFHEKIREILLPKSRVVASRILLDLPEISVPERYPDRRVMTTGWAALRLAEPVSLPPLPLGSSESLKAGDGVIIIQHPHAGFKHFVLQPHGVISNDEQLLLYRADTLPGSSGAPVFDLNMHVVAVHFLGRPEGNGGVPIEVIKAGLRDRGLDFISAP